MSKGKPAPYTIRCTLRFIRPSFSVCQTFFFIMIPATAFLPSGLRWLWCLAFGYRRIYLSLNPPLLILIQLLMRRRPFVSSWFRFLQATYIDFFEVPLASLSTTARSWTLPPGNISLAGHRGNYLTSLASPSRWMADVGLLVNILLRLMNYILKVNDHCNSLEALLPGICSFNGIAVLALPI